MDLDFEAKKALIYVKPDQQSLAIGKRGQNVRLASKLSKWDLDIVTVSDAEIEKLRKGEMPQQGVPLSAEGVFPERAAEAAKAVGVADVEELDAGTVEEESPPGQDSPAESAATETGTAETAVETEGEDQPLEDEEQKLAAETRDNPAILPDSTKEESEDEEVDPAA
jgi:N utilization substance protein A